MEYQYLTISYMYSVEDITKHEKNSIYKPKDGIKYLVYLDPQILIL